MHLSTHSVSSLPDLTRLSRAIEETEMRVQKFAPPPTSYRTLLEPELAYRRAPTQAPTYLNAVRGSESQITGSALNPAVGEPTPTVNVPEMVTGNPPRYLLELRNIFVFDLYKKRLERSSLGRQVDLNSVSEAADPKSQTILDSILAHAKNDTRPYLNDYWIQEPLAQFLEDQTSHQGNISWGRLGDELLTWGSFVAVSYSMLKRSAVVGSMTSASRADISPATDGLSPGFFAVRFCPSLSFSVSSGSDILTFLCRLSSPELRGVDSSLSGDDVLGRFPNKVPKPSRRPAIAPPASKRVLAVRKRLPASCDSGGPKTERPRQIRDFGYHRNRSDGKVSRYSAPASCSFRSLLVHKSETGYKIRCSLTTLREGLVDVLMDVVCPGVPGVYEHPGHRRPGAVDRTDMMLSSTECVRKTVKWYKKLFFHIVDLCLLNSHALYLTQNQEKVPLATFQLNLIRQLLEKYNLPKVTPVKPTLRNPELMGRHFPALVPDNKVRRCTVCAKLILKRRKRRESRYMCSECNVGLCVHPCFEFFVYIFKRCRINTSVVLMANKKSGIDGIAMSNRLGTLHRLGGAGAFWGGLGPSGGDASSGVGGSWCGSGCVWSCCRSGWGRRRAAGRLGLPGGGGCVGRRPLPGCPPGLPDVGSGLGGWHVLGLLFPLVVLFLDLPEAALVFSAFRVACGMFPLRSWHRLGRSSPPPSSVGHSVVMCGPAHLTQRVIVLKRVSARYMNVWNRFVGPVMLG
ncbi:hypothetical protein NQ318_020378 [Aromia moschata]|uniref:PiggyBac transposable element-derived protein domain-containing protein n=1 Tax=Aromia moschata TaxID=1265417 RepID=A0AAV8Y4B5_9CUCU|nr:hypothetical protein NQ318_020378 [Aromia moschata]